MKLNYILLFLAILNLTFPTKTEAQIRPVINQTINFLSQHVPGGLPQVNCSISLIDPAAPSGNFEGVSSKSFQLLKDSNYSNPAIQLQKNIKAVYFGSNGKFVQSDGLCNNSNTYFRLMFYKNETGLIGQIFTYKRSTDNNQYIIKNFALNDQSELLINSSLSRDYGNSVTGMTYIISGLIKTLTGEKLFLSIKIHQMFMGSEGPL